jgi:hypothetical protein
MVVKNTLFFKDLKFPDGYFPVYLLDLAAARYHLDNKNNRSGVNTSSIYLIGSDTAATIGMAWLASEWNRPAFVPNANQLLGSTYPTYKYVPQPLAGGLDTEAGTDISGAVWLSANRPTGNRSISPILIKSWAAKYAPKMRDNNPMLFLYGEKDLAAKKQADFFFNEVLVAKPRPGMPLRELELTFEKPVGGTELSGVNLLGNNDKLKTEDTIMSFLSSLQKERANRVPKDRGFNSPWLIQIGPIGVDPGFGFRP